MTDNSEIEKRRIRSAVRNSRAARDELHRREDRDRLTRQLTSLVDAHGARSVTCYLSLGDEPDTAGFIAWAQSRGVDVLLPVSQAGHRMQWARLSAAGTAPGRHGVQEPIGIRLPVESAARVDLMIIPACAVDVTGVRLGWGLGYFDRALAALTSRPPVYAVVHDSEVFPQLPSDPHDVSITGVVTPAGIRVFHTGPG